MFPNNIIATYGHNGTIHTQIAIEYDDKYLFELHDKHKSDLFVNTYLHDITLLALKGVPASNIHTTNATGIIYVDEMRKQLILNIDSISVNNPTINSNIIKDVYVLLDHIGH